MELVLRPASQKAIYRKQGNSMAKKNQKSKPNRKHQKEPLKLYEQMFSVTATKS